jgi:hypothetical protein
MTALALFLARHGAGIAAAAVAALPLPYLTNRISWRLSTFFEEDGGITMYSPSWTDQNATPMFLTLAIVALLAIGADALRRRLRWLSWSFPVLLAALFGTLSAIVVARVASPYEFPSYAPFVTGVTFATVSGILFGAYWGAMLLTAQLSGRAARE